MSHESVKYSSDLTDEQWEQLRPLLPLKQTGPGRPIELDMRQVINAILYLLRTGCQWANLPHDFPNTTACFTTTTSGCMTEHGNA